MSTAHTPPPPVQRTSKTDRLLRYTFTDAEILEIGRQMAQAAQQRDRVEDERKSVMAQLKSRHEEASAKINLCSTRISAGYEMRSIMCEVHYDKPSTGRKTLYRLDNGEMVGIEDMSSEERQLQLRFEDKQAAAAQLATPPVVTFSVVPDPSAEAEDPDDPDGDDPDDEDGDDTGEGQP